jgi:hypothetical protein
MGCKRTQIVFQRTATREQTQQPQRWTDGTSASFPQALETHSDLSARGVVKTVHSPAPSMSLRCPWDVPVLSLACPSVSLACPSVSLGCPSAVPGLSLGCP